MHYAPGREPCPLPFSPFKSCTVPRPIGWLSTVSAAGVANLAPYSQWQNLTFDPPMVMFAANQYPDGRRKDTVLNAEETGWFVWNMATWALREAVNISAMAVPPEVDELPLAGFETAPCDHIRPPRIVSAPVAFECRRYVTLQCGHARDIVLGEVLAAHIRDDLYDAGREYISWGSEMPIARLFGTLYADLSAPYPGPVPSAKDVMK